MTSNFKVTAIIAAYNEADVIAQVVDDLIAQGVSVFLLDDASTDDTTARVKPLLDRGLIGVERLAPITRSADDPTTLYCWRRILTRKQELARELPGDWFIHHDADELRESPWSNLDLRQAIQLVDRLGYDAIDFQLFAFWPTDDRFRPGDDLREAFPYCEAGSPHDKLQIRCWKRTDGPLDLVSSGGHEAVFPGRRVFPLRFVLRHYPFRGSAHGRRKLLQERLPRYDPDELAFGWHRQYDDVGELSFVRDPTTLSRFDPNEVRARLAVDNRLVEELRGDPGALALREEGRERELALLRQELDARTRELARLGEEIDDLRRSLSWRLTAPLRAALRAARGY